MKHFGVYEKVYQLFLERLSPAQKAILYEAERLDAFIINAKDEICKLSNKEIIALSNIIDEIKNTFDAEYN